jgi:hypothetical protein
VLPLDHEMLSSVSLYYKGSISSRAAHIPCRPTSATLSLTGAVPACLVELAVLALLASWRLPCLGCGPCPRCASCGCLPADLPSRRAAACPPSRYCLPALRPSASPNYRHIIKTACIFLDHLDHLRLAPTPRPFLSANLDHLTPSVDHLTPHFDRLTLNHPKHSFYETTTAPANSPAVLSRDYAAARRPTGALHFAFGPAPSTIHYPLLAAHSRRDRAAATLRPARYHAPVARDCIAAMERRLPVRRD